MGVEELRIDETIQTDSSNVDQKKSKENEFNSILYEILVTKGIQSISQSLTQETCLMRWSSLLTKEHQVHAEWEFKCKHVS